MRHKGVDKEETRQKVVAAASRGFRQQGYAGLGIDALAKGAGVTSGAIYSHFGSKQGVFAEALASGLDEVIVAIPKLQRDHGQAWVAAFCEFYLSKAHRQDGERCCAMATLSPEVQRFGIELQAQYAQKMQHIAELMAEGLDSVESAWALLALLIGGLTMARAAGNEVQAEAIAQSVTARVALLWPGAQAAKV